MNQRLACLLVLAGCKSSQHWEQRSGPTFTVLAPELAQINTIPLPSPDGPIPMVVYTYRNTLSESLQVQIGEVPKSSAPDQAIAKIHDRIASKSQLLAETTIQIGGVPGKDMRYLSEFPSFGKMTVHNRVLLYDRHIYQVMAVHRPDQPDLDAEADRFVESFAFTRAPVPPVVAPSVGSNGR